MRRGNGEQVKGSVRRRRPTPRSSRLAIAAALVVAVWAVGCSSAPERADRPLDEAAQVEASPSAEELMAGAETTASPTSEELAEGGGDQEGSERVDSGIASDISGALSDAAAGDVEGAIAELQGLVSSPDGGFLAAYNIGVLRERQGQYDKAAQRYFQALQKNPNFTQSLRNLVRLYLRQGRPADAERIAQRFIEQRPDNLAHRAVLLEVGVARGNYEDVIRTAKELLRRDERQVDAMVVMAEANFELGRYELSKAVIDRAVELAPGRAELYNLAGTVEIKLDDTPSAIANFEKAVELRPSYPEAHNNLGVLFHQARDYEAAAEHFRAAVRDYPDYKEAFLNLGNAYKGLGRFKDAELAFQKALGIDEQFADAHFNLGILYLDSEIPGMEPIPRLQKAIDAFNRYKQAARGKMSKEDPADKYVDEAKKAIEVERQRQEMMRESQMGGENAGEG